MCTEAMNNYGRKEGGKDRGRRDIAIIIFAGHRFD